MKLEIGKIHNKYVTLPRFMVSLSRPRWCYRPLWIFGRLYRGYVGVYWITRWFSLNIWVHSMEREAS